MQPTDPPGMDIRQRIHALLPHQKGVYPESQNDVSRDDIVDAYELDGEISAGFAIQIC